MRRPRREASDPRARHHCGSHCHALRNESHNYAERPQTRWRTPAEQCRASSALPRQAFDGMRCGAHRGPLASAGRRADQVRGPQPSPTLARRRRRVADAYRPTMLPGSPHCRKPFKTAPWPKPWKSSSILTSPLWQTSTCRADTVGTDRTFRAVMKSLDPDNPNQRGLQIPPGTGNRRTFEGHLGAFRVNRPNFPRAFRDDRLRRALLNEMKMINLTVRPLPCKNGSDCYGPVGGLLQSQQCVVGRGKWRLLCSREKLRSRDNQKQ